MSGCQDPQVIPASLFDSNGILYLNSGIFPKPNVEGQDKNITNPSNPIDLRDDIVRVDHKFNDKWSILGHFMHDSDVEGYAIPFLGWGWASYNTITSTLSNPSYSAAIKLSGTINPNLLVEASINYDGNIIDIVNSDNSKQPQGWDVTPVSPAFKVTRNSLPSVYGMMPYFVCGRHGVSAVAQRRPRHRVQSGYFANARQARPEVWVQLQPVHQEPAALR